VIELMRHKVIQGADRPTSKVLGLRLFEMFRVTFPFIKIDTLSRVFDV
jgi:hypothetical protein